MTDHDYRDILLKAAERVVEPGKWCQGSAYEGTSMVAWADRHDVAACAWGTLRLIAYRMGLLDKTEGQIQAEVYNAGTAVEAVLNDPEHHLTTWNDAPERTAQDVADLFREAAQR